MPKRERSTDSATAVAEVADVDTSEEVSVAQVQTITREIQSVVVEVPLGELGSGYMSRDLRTHLNSQLTRDQSRGMARLVTGLRMIAATIEGGKSVKSNADAIRWVLEQIENTTR